MCWFNTKTSCFIICKLLFTQIYIDNLHKLIDENKIDSITVFLKKYINIFLLEGNKSIEYINPKLNVIDIRGNVDTRIKKMERGEYDGLILAAAGIERLGLDKYITEFISNSDILSAPGQGAIAVEIKKDNIQLKKITSSINDEFSRVTTSTERSFMKLMGGGCNYPIAALSTVKNDKILIDGLVINLNGTKLIRSSAEDNINNWHDLSIRLANTFYKKGAQAILNEIDNENS